MRKKFCLFLFVWLAFLKLSDAEFQDLLTGFNPFAFALLENHYMANRCFLKEGQLLDNAIRMAAIPAVIVNGRYDAICPPITAYKLHQKMPLSKLVIVPDAGHSAGEPGITAALVKAMRNFEKN